MMLQPDLLKLTKDFTHTFCKWIKNVVQKTALAPVPNSHHPFTFIVTPWNNPMITHDNPQTSWWIFLIGTAFYWRNSPCEMCWQWGLWIIQRNKEHCFRKEMWLLNFQAWIWNAVSTTKKIKFIIYYSGRQQKCQRWTYWNLSEWNKKFLQGEILLEVGTEPEYYFLLAIIHTQTFYSYFWKKQAQWRVFFPQ